MPTPRRFAHDSFVKTPKPGEGLIRHIEKKLHPIPSVNGEGVITLEDVIGVHGATGIQASKRITIQVAGDTGVPGSADRDTHQEEVARAMALDWDTHRPDTCPAFFLHLGDVIYGTAKGSYLDQFYAPYKSYPGKIVPIAGNHDCDFDGKLEDFQKNFCAPTQSVNAMAGTIFRETMNLPGVYWRMKTPFADIIGLFSNCAENPGFISSPSIGSTQKDWLLKTLKTIKKERSGGTKRALLMATHHPPYSAGLHSGSKEMLADLDDTCNSAGIFPDAFFSGHAHSIQRYTRVLNVDGKKKKIPFIVSGCGGHGGQHVDTKFPVTNGDSTYEFGYKGYGYTNVTITGTSLTIDSFKVETVGKSGTVKRSRIDTITVKL